MIVYLNGFIYKKDSVNQWVCLMSEDDNADECEPIEDNELIAQLNRLA